MRSFEQYNPRATALWLLICAGIAMLCPNPVILCLSLAGAAALRIVRRAKESRGSILFYIALVVMTGAAGVLGWQLYRASRALKRSERQRDAYQQDHAIRQNLQRVVDRREAEIRTHLETELSAREQTRIYTVITFDLAAFNEGI